MRHIVKWMMVVINIQLSVSYQSQAKDLGTFGETFPIIEVNILTWFQDELNKWGESGELDKYVKLLKEKIAKNATNPKPVSGLSRAVQARVFIIDPTITLSQEILSPEGKVIIPKGTTINPLTKVNLSKPLVFFNAEDSLQKAWVKKNYMDAKIILVAGKPLDLAEDWQKDIFFDQGGVLTQKLKIKAVPAVVRQKGVVLEINEYVIKGET